MRQKPFLQYLKDDNTSTLRTIHILRQLDYGPTTVMRKFWRELTYVGIWVQKALLLVAFNAVGVCVFFWLLSLL